MIVRMASVQVEPERIEEIVSRYRETVRPTAGCGDIDTCRTPCICERLSTPSTEGHAPIMLRGSTTLKTAVYTSARRGYATTTSS